LLGANWVYLCRFARSRRLLSDDDERALVPACKIPDMIPTDRQAKRLIRLAERTEGAGWNGPRYLSRSQSQACERQISVAVAMRVHRARVVAIFRQMSGESASPAVRIEEVVGIHYETAQGAG
jgi:hypothetical protein